MKMIEKDVGCMARPRNVYCFDAGKNFHYLKCSYKFLLKKNRP
ncbi:UNVERIFIED_CONTAM: hypothetical protein NCL1_30574 [Trichonephila clavipes]